MTEKNIFLDVDGVLLVPVSRFGPGIRLADHAGEFLTQITDRHRCFWLTSHCQGDSATVLSYLSEHVPASLVPMLRKFEPTKWRTLKTEALFGDFYWIDDAPLQAEVDQLERMGMEGRLLRIDSGKRPDGLLDVLRILVG